MCCIADYNSISSHFGSGSEAATHLGCFSRLGIGHSHGQAKILGLMATMIIGPGAIADGPLQGLNVCSGGPAESSMSGYIGIMVVLVFFLGLVCGVAVALMCLGPVCGVAVPASRPYQMGCGAKLEKASQSQTTYTRNAAQPRFQPLPEHGHG